MPSAGAPSPGDVTRQRQTVGLTRNGFQEMRKAESFSDHPARVADIDLPASVALISTLLFPSSNPAPGI